VPVLLGNLCSNMKLCALSLHCRLQIVVGGLLIEEVELLTYPNGSWSQCTEVDTGEWSGLCFGACLYRM